MWVWISSLVSKLFIIKFQKCYKTNLDLEDKILSALGRSDEHISPKYNFIAILNSSMKFQFPLTVSFEIRRPELHKNLRHKYSKYE
jgi:hypothetical protein